LYCHITSSWDVRNAPVDDTLVHLGNSNLTRVWFESALATGTDVDEYAPNPCAQVLAHWRAAFLETTATTISTTSVDLEPSSSCYGGYFSAEQQTARLIAQKANEYVCGKKRAYIEGFMNFD